MLNTVCNLNVLKLYDRLLNVLWRRHLTDWQPVTSAVFLACLLWSVNLYDAICCRIVSILRLLECVIKNVIIILQYARQTRTK